MIKILIPLIFLFTNILFAKDTSIYVKLYTTQYNSTSHEIVNDPQTNKKLSELIWEIKDISLLGLSTKIQTRRDLKINIGIEIMPSTKKGIMNDYDWLKDNTSNWSDWSNHPNTKITKIINLDFNLEYKLKDDRFKNKYIINAGVNIRHHAFEAYDGSYIYSSDSGFRDNIGTFNDGLGISYDETFTSLYLKGNLYRTIDRYVIGASFLYSPITFITNNDTHHLRSFTNNNKFNVNNMYEVGLTARYYIQKNISIGIDYKYRLYPEVAGITTRTYSEDNVKDNASKGDSYTYKGAAIKSSSTSLANLSIVLKF